MLYRRFVAIFDIGKLTVQLYIQSGVNTIHQYSLVETHVQWRQWKRFCHF